MRSLLVAGLCASVFLLAGYETGRVSTRIRPQVLGIMACGQLYAVFVTEPTGEVLAATPHSRLADDIARRALAVPDDRRSIVTLEAPCRKADTATVFH